MSCITCIEYHTFITCPCRFNSLLPYESPQQLDGLLEEFIDFQLLQDHDIPPTVWEQATVVVDTDSGNTYHRMDIIWHYLSHMRSPDHTLRFN